MSLVVRGCWLVSFFFTPIYMFILNFIVMFGVKKGSIVVYRASWASLLSHQVFAVFYNFNKYSFKELSKLYLYRFHYTAITSRTTSYFLFLFWLFFFFFGESLLLILFNYMTPVDSIMSHSFFMIKQHVIFLTESVSTKLTNTINFYIYFLTTCSFLYLINLNFSLNYNFFRKTSVITTLPMFIFLFFLL
jgi:hypothetical protein